MKTIQEGHDGPNLLTWVLKMNPKPSAAELFGTWGHHSSKLRRAQLCNPLYQFSSIWAKLFWNRVFFFILPMYFYASNPGAPGVRPLWTLEPWFEQTWQKTTRQCYKPNFNIWGKWFWRRDFWIFSTYFYDSNLGLSGAGPFCTPPFEHIS